MTDQELLEYAAKAVDEGICFYGECWRSQTGCEWNPLLSDADAFRLAVRLTLSVYPPEDDDPTAAVEDWTWGVRIIEVDEDGDYLATTRRAIVRAAAEIGRNMSDG